MQHEAYQNGIRRSREGAQTDWARGNSSDLEGDKQEDDEDGVDDEPSLGSENVRPGRVISWRAWGGAQCAINDAGVDQRDWSFGSGGRDVDAEGDDADAENDGTESEPNGDEQDNTFADDEGTEPPLGMAA